MNKQDIIADILIASCHSQQRYIKKHYPDLESEILSYPGREWPEHLYNWMYDKHEIQKCIACGGPSKFRNIKNGYYNACSHKCGNATRGESCSKTWRDKSQNDKNIIVSKRRSTLLDRYGVDNPSKLESVKLKKIETTRKNWGVDNPFQSETIKKDIHKKLSDQYGGVGFQSASIREKVEQVCQERYGARNFSQTQSFKSDFDKILQTRHPEIIRRFKNENGEYMYECSCIHPECNMCDTKKFIISAYSFAIRPHYHAELCTNVLPYQDWRSAQEKQICDFLDLYNIKYEAPNRKLLHGTELDIYIPDKQIAIECNGCYWHSTKFKDSSFHIKKFNKCKDNNIKLISIWEDMWINKPDIVKSLILAKLGRFEHRTGASKCKLKTVPKEEAQQFLEANHLQGRCGAVIHYGLYYKDELVSMMSFGKRRPGMGAKTAVEGQYELLRFCNKCNWQVVGGASRLLKHFIRDYQPKEIISFSSNDISDGSLYQSLGFRQIGHIECSYWYINPHSMQRYHRYSFTKADIIKKGLAPDRPDWAEQEAMNEAGYYCIYDSGIIKWLLKLP